MIYLFGNCQMEFLARSLEAQCQSVVFRSLASPLTDASHSGVPPLLAEMGERFHFEPHLSGRTLFNQYVMLESHERPDLIVINLFHENEPLFAHKDDGYVFFIDPCIWEEQPGLERWMKRHFQLLKPNPETYGKRFAQLVARLRLRCPDVPLLIVTRLTHYPAFGPRPFSYLRAWDTGQQETKAWLRQLVNELPDCHLLDMDRVFAGIWAAGERNIAAHCPFLRVTVHEAEGRAWRMDLRRDVEHVGSMWPRLAEKILDFLREGRVRYSLDESLPRDWSTPSQPEQLGVKALAQMFDSGSNYFSARAMCSLLQTPDCDATPLLARYGASFPVCHNLLHMIDNYGRIHNNPQLALWCQAHRPRAVAFEDKGPAYRKQYLERLDCIERRSLGQ